ncbi:MAG: Wzz/FepE/Etk N-terminal domain-containing protein, partial [Gemmatimonadota bacterium]|nr:Wzz/FepE/Etk N-terminal domain-containing protein [Gemmatimonadota bacterium]
MAEHLSRPPDGSGTAVVPVRSSPIPFDADGQFRSDGEGSGTDWRRYVAGVVRYKWIVVVATLIGTGGGVVALRFQPPDYEAQATVWAASSSVGPSPIQSGQLLQASAWVDLLQSYAVLDHAVRNLRLFVQYENPADSALFAAFDLQPRFAPGRFVLEVSERGDRVALSMRGGDIVDEVAVGDSIGRPVGFSWAPTGSLLRPGARVIFEVANPRDVARGIGTNLRVEATDRVGNFIKVSLIGKNPVRVAATVNEVLTRFVQLAAELKRVQLTEKVGILREQLQNAAGNLREAEERLERFKVQTIAMPAERAMPIVPGLEMTQDPAMQTFFNMRIEVEQLRRDREAIERLIASGGSGDWDPMGLELVGSVQGSSDLKLALSQLTEKRSALRALQTQYTVEHPQVRRLAGEIEDVKMRVIPGLARTLIADLTTRETVVEDRLGSATNELRQIPPRRIEEDRLARGVAIAENLFTILQQRYEESRLAEVSSISDVSILDAAAVPQRPVSHRAQRFLMMGVAGGFGL